MGTDRLDMDKRLNARVQTSDEDKNVPLEYISALAHSRAA